MAKGRKKPEGVSVESFIHKEERRKNIPTAELQSVVQEDQIKPVPAIYPRRNRDLDPQLVWRGKDEQDLVDLNIPTMPLYIQEKIHPKALIENLFKKPDETFKQGELFGDFSGLELGVDHTEFYQHDQNWTNRMILGDSLQVMASLAEREGLRGKVQCIYFDPPYGIKFNSNFQWSTTSRDVKDGNAGHITREPEQVKAFRDTWRDGIHSYLTYLRDRLTVARDLLTDSGSIFVQIGDENVHRVRAVMDEVFGEDQFVSLITFTKTEGLAPDSFSNVTDFIIWFAKKKSHLKYRDLKTPKKPGEAGATGYILLDRKDRTAWRAATQDEIKTGLVDGYDFFDDQPLISQDAPNNRQEPFWFEGKPYHPAAGRHWSTGQDVSKLVRLANAGRIIQRGERVEWKRYIDEVAGTPLNNVWLGMGDRGFTGDKKVYVVQTAPEVIHRCMLMSTDPGDLVLDPTCGSGTTATVAEQWGRRWITIDTSRVALALARARIMGARYPYYLLADSQEGQLKEAEVTKNAPSTKPVYGNLRHGFVYERVPHITLKSIANNTEIDVIWEKWQTKLEPIRESINSSLKKKLEEWEIPRECEEEWPQPAKKLHAEWWKNRISRQQEIDASIAAKAEFEYLYDKPYIDKKKIRVAGPFTVESLSPHRTLELDEQDNLVDPLKPKKGTASLGQDFCTIILENLRTSGVQQTHKEDKINFTSLTPWPGHLVCAEGTYLEGETQRRAGIFIGPEFGTVQRSDLVQAAREAADANFDILISCAFNFEAHTTEFSKLGKLPILKARMNADLHMAGDLKNTGKGNLFVIFGEPDIEIEKQKDGLFRVKIKGVDVFDPTSGKVRSDDADDIACWFIDTDYDGESFFVRHAYFPGTNDPYKALKTSLKTEINEEAWSSLNSKESRPFAKPMSGRIAIKVINHLGDEVLKAYKIS